VLAHAEGLGDVEEMRGGGKLSRVHARNPEALAPSVMQDAGHAQSAPVDTGYR